MSWCPTPSCPASLLRAAGGFCGAGLVLRSALACSVLGREPAEGVPGKLPPVAHRSRGLDEASLLVIADRRHADRRAPSELANRKQVIGGDAGHNRTLAPASLDLKLA